MTNPEPFLVRIPTLSDEELMEYLAHPAGFKAEAVEAAVLEWGRRGHGIPEGVRRELREGLEREARPLPILGRHRELRRASWMVLLGGLGASALLWLLAAAPAGEGPAGDPFGSKRYLRDLEMVGGKGNVMAAEFMAWFRDLWQGRPLAVTVLVLALLLALLLRLLGPRTGAEA